MEQFIWLSCRYVGGVWTLVVTGMDGIVFWGPILIHFFIDKDSETGELPSFPQ